MKIASIDLALIDQSLCKKMVRASGKKACFADIAFFENKEGQDKFGNDGFVVQSVSKEARDRGEKGPIIGNWKETEKKSDPTKWADRTKPAPRTTDEPSEPEDDDIPF